MKILKFETTNHPILGDCSLDFSSAGNFSDIVLIAGSNGSGKTTILDELFRFLSNVHPTSLNYDLIVTFSLSDEEIEILRPIENQIGKVLTIKSLRKYPTGPNWGQIKALLPSGEISPNFIQNETFKNLIKCVYSTVEINFAKNTVASTTAQDIDSVVVPKEKSSAKISQEIAQLLVDIKALDDSDAAEWVRSHNGEVVNSADHQERISRFKRAFDYMIEGKTFQGVKNEDGRKKVYFKDSEGNEIDISDLSSGEKQIVFRAGYLLKNIGTLSGGIILIDEPEISFHPSWQEKYIEFLKKTFSNDQGGIQTQIIIATHSPFIVQNEKISDEKIIILQKSGRNTTESVWPKFYGYKQPEPVFVPIEQTTKSLLLVEGKSDKQIIACAWKKLYPETEMPFEIKWPNEPHEGGAREVQKQLVYFVQHGNQKVLGIYDADQKGLNDYNGTICKIEPFKVDSEVANLKISRKVGATCIPPCLGREIYFNSNPQLSFLVLEMYLSDSDLQTLGIIDSEKITFASQELIKIKSNHSVSDSSLETLPVESFNNFKELFAHIDRCFNKIT